MVFPHSSRTLLRQGPKKESLQTIENMSIGKLGKGASIKVQWVKALATKPKYPGSILRSHIGRRKQIPTGCALTSKSIYTHASTHTLKKW